MKLIKHKFKVKPTELDGIKFASKKEGVRYLELKQLKELGKVTFFLRQTPFHLPGNIKYVCDFLVFWEDGTTTVEDVKGFKTPTYKAKKKMVESIYPIEIKEI